MANILSRPYAPMSSKRQKMTAKRGRASEEPTRGYDHTKVVNEGVAENFGLISKKGPFIKEKRFHHPEDFFRKTIVNKGWRALCQPPKLATTMIVREFYANLATNMNKRVRVCGIWVDFGAKSINKFFWNPWTMGCLTASMRPRTTPKSLGIDQLAR